MIQKMMELDGAEESLHHAKTTIRTTRGVKRGAYPINNWNSYLFSYSVLTPLYPVSKCHPEHQLELCFKQLRHPRLLEAPIFENDKSAGNPAHDLEDKESHHQPSNIQRKVLSSICILVVVYFFPLVDILGPLQNIYIIRVPHKTTLKKYFPLNYKWSRLMRKLSGSSHSKKALLHSHTWNCYHLFLSSRWSGFNVK
jgi:hypothetical protein